MKTSYQFGAQDLGGGRVLFRLWHLQPQRWICFSKRQTSPGKFLCRREKTTGSPAGRDNIHRGRPISTGFELTSTRSSLTPASRYQPGDVHGPSLLVLGSVKKPRPGKWQGRPWIEAVIYELHVGTFTPEGRLPPCATAAKLDYLAELGVLTGYPTDAPGRFSRRAQLGL